MTVIGIDSHKDTLSGVLADESGRPLEERIFSNTPRGHTQAAAWVQDTAARRVAIEGSGNYGRSLALALTAIVDVVDVPPQMTARARKTQRTHTKSDSTDALLMLVGALSYSGRFRGWVTSRQDQPHLIEGIDAVLRRLGGTARRWRVDRMATVIDPGTGRLQSSFVPVAKHYGVGVDPCPPRHPQRKGVVEKAIHFISQRWWRTASVARLASAQDSLDRFCVAVGDSRRRGESTVGELADTEPLLELPLMPYPAEGTLYRRVASNGLVSVWGNRYSVPPGVIGTQVTVRWRLGDPTIDMTSESGRLVATHRKVARGQGRVVRLPEHVEALENVVLAAFTTKRPCRPKPNRPPSEAALAVASGIGGDLNTESVIDLGVYQRHIDLQHRRRR